MIYLQIETEFSSYSWCEMIMRGIYDEVKRKRIDLQEISSADQITIPGSCVLLLGATHEWITSSAKQVHAKNCRPIALDGHHPTTGDLGTSSIMMDIHGSMRLALDYLHRAGRTRIALYGVNPNSSSDIWRAELFQQVTGSGEHIFYNDVSVAALFSKFSRVIDRYDGVICANDIVAVNLLKRLQEQNISIPEKLYIISYGNMNISRLTDPGITSISNDHEHFGKAALAACSVMERNSNISTIHIQLRSRLHIRGSTDFLPYDPDQNSSPNSGWDNRFYSDPEVAKLAKLETMFCQCDDTDHALIRLVLENASYAAMAQQCYISETAAKYRVRKMERLCGVSSRLELQELLKNFF